jgi:hypothetical protein
MRCLGALLNDGVEKGDTGATAKNSIVMCIRAMGEVNKYVGTDPVLKMDHEGTPAITRTRLRTHEPTLCGCAAYGAAAWGSPARSRAE